MQVSYLFEPKTQFKISIKIGKKIFLKNKTFLWLIGIDILFFLIMVVASGYIQSIINGLIEYFLQEGYILEDLTDVRSINWIVWTLFVLVILYTSYRPYFTAKTLFLAQIKSFANKTITLNLAEQGLLETIEDSRTQILIDYKELHLTKEYKQHLVLILNTAQYYAIPFSAFDSENSRLHFKQILQTKIDESSHC